MESFPLVIIINWINIPSFLLFHLASGCLLIMMDLLSLTGFIIYLRMNRRERREEKKDSDWMNKVFVEPNRELFAKSVQANELMV